MIRLAFPDDYKDRIGIINDQLMQSFEVMESVNLRAAMAHYPAAGGKRLRPLLATMVCEAFGGDPDKAVRANQHIMDSNSEKIADYGGLLDSMSVIRRAMERGRISPSPDEVADALSKFDSELGEAKTGNKYMSPRFKGVRQEIASELVGARDDIVRSDFKAALDRLDAVEPRVFTVISLRPFVSA